MCAGPTVPTTSPTGITAGTSRTSWVQRAIDSARAASAPPPVSTPTAITGAPVFSSRILAPKVGAADLRIPTGR